MPSSSERCSARVTTIGRPGCAGRQGQRLVAVRRAGHREPAPVGAPQLRGPPLPLGQQLVRVLDAVQPAVQGASPAVTAPVRSLPLLVPGHAHRGQRAGLRLRGEPQPGVQQRRVGAPVPGGPWDPWVGHPGLGRRLLRLVPVEGDGLRGQRGVAQDQVGGLLRGHHDRGVDVAVGDVRHDRGIHDPQPVQPVHPHAWPGRSRRRRRCPSWRCTTGAARSRRPGGPSPGSARRSRPRCPGTARPRCTRRTRAGSGCPG